MSKAVENKILLRQKWGSVLTAQDYENMRLWLPYLKPIAFIMIAIGAIFLILFFISLFTNKRKKLCAFFAIISPVFLIGFTIVYSIQSNWTMSISNYELFYSKETASISDLCESESMESSSIEQKNKSDNELSVNAQLFIDKKIEFDNSNSATFSILQSEGKITGVSFVSFDGKDVQKEYIRMMCIAVVMGKLAVPQFTIGGVSGEESIALAFNDGEMSNNSIMPSKYDGVVFNKESDDYTNELSNLLDVLLE